MPDLRELLADPSRAAALSADEAVVSLGELAALTTVLAARLGLNVHDSTATVTRPESVTIPAWSSDDLLTADEAAVLLKVSPRWLYRHAPQLPFARKLSRKVLRFSRSGALKWLEKQRP